MIEQAVKNCLDLGGMYCNRLGKEKYCSLYNPNLEEDYICPNLRTHISLVIHKGKLEIKYFGCDYNGRTK